MNWLQKISHMSIQDLPAFLANQEHFSFLKYVRVAGEYRFANALTAEADHKQMANGEPVEGAGFLKVYPDGLFVEGHSVTLQVGPAADDEERLSGLLGIPVRGRPV